MKRNIGTLWFLLVCVVLSGSRSGLSDTGFGLGDWPSSGHDLSNSGNSSTERVLSPENVGNLQLKWEHGPKGVIGTPIIADGIAYLADIAGVLWARNADTGTLVWATQVTPLGLFDVQFGGSVISAPVVTQDAVYLGHSVSQRGAAVYKVSRRDGKVLWATTVDSNPNTGIQGDPIAYNGRIYVGVASFENDQPGADQVANFTVRVAWLPWMSWERSSGRRIPPQTKVFPIPSLAQA